mgnify:CR=1 FL=1
MKRDAFIMIELIIVIVIIGVPVAIAIPILNATREDVKISVTCKHLSICIEGTAFFALMID